MALTNTCSKDFIPEARLDVKYTLDSGRCRNRKDGLECK